jgi:hypothetical protein
MWSLGFLEMNKRKKIFDRIIELRNDERDDIRIGRLFLWGQTSEGSEFWGNLALRQSRFIVEHTFFHTPTIIELDENGDEIKEVDYGLYAV